ncbi:NAD(P)-dependent oxidoreductase [Candidatus Woesearchaeota archaeon]|jgi:UDP-glucose 4-epimerase|nr:NAD(P)-dependent oxidoreductase [Candidatus Woesearchaeota archaeon]MBT7367637.1 NAD(P)-dependent oxidoreductase [Candidatus Woesearchaeota archaeon]
MKKIILFGGFGYIGLKLAKKLTELNYSIKIFAPNLKKTNADFLNQIEKIKGSILNINEVKNAIDDVDCIINLAAKITKFGTNENILSELNINCGGQINILEALKQKNKKTKNIFIGSRSQFGKVKLEDMPISEDYPQNPISIYGIQKQTAEKYCKFYNNAYNVNTIIIRPVAVYGPGIDSEKENSVLNKLIRTSVNDEKFYIYGYGKDIKDFIYIDDLIDAIILLIKTNIYDGTFNIGSGKGIIYKEIGNMILGKSKKELLEYRDFPEDTKKFETGSFVADITAIKKIGWVPKTDIKTGIEKTIKYYKKIKGN